MKLAKIIALLMVVIVAALSIAACNNTEGEGTSLPDVAVDENNRFDYTNSNMEKYISVDESLYKGASFTLPAYLDGSDAAVQAYIQLLLEAYPTETGNKIVDRAIQNGDTVALYYEGWLDGEKFSGGSNMDDADPYMLEIGSGTFIPGFEEGLVGLVPNQNNRDNLYDLHISFPDSYHQADLAGKAVVFKVYVEYIAEYAPAEYTEEFITDTLKYSTNETDIKAAFEKYIKDEMLPFIKKQQIISEFWTEIMEKAAVKEYPQSELDYYFNTYEASYKEEYQKYPSYYSSMFGSYDGFIEAYLGANWKADLEEQSKTDVKQNLIFHYIAQKENIVINNTDYQAAIEYYIDYYAAEGYTVTASQVESEMGERKIKEQALWDKVNEFIVANCEITYE